MARGQSRWIAHWIASSEVGLVLMVMDARSDVPHREHDVVDVEESHERLGFGIGWFVGAPAQRVLLEPCTALRTFGGRGWFMSLCTVGSQMSVVNGWMEGHRRRRAHVLITVFVDHALDEIG